MAGTKWSSILTDHECLVILSTTSVATLRPTAGNSGTGGHFHRNAHLINLEVPPVIENGRALVPFRTLAEALGAGVDWDGTNRTVTLTRADTVIRLKIGDQAALVNDKAVILDAPAVIINGRTLVPLRFIDESLGADVRWDGAQRVITVKSQ